MQRGSNKKQILKRETKERSWRYTQIQKDEMCEDEKAM